jgi:hypothetical protein
MGRSIVPNLKKLLKKWQARLGLAHWKLSATYVEALEMNDPGDFGEVQHNLLRRWARIKILKPSAAKGEVILPFEVEHTLVHELVHLVIAPVAKHCDDLRALEHTVDDLTNALLYDSEQDS